MNAFKIKKSIWDIVNEILGYITIAAMWFGMMMMFVVCS